MNTSTQAPTASSVFTLDNNSALWSALDSGVRCEVDQEAFDHYMEVLPPKLFRRYVTVSTGENVLADFGFAEGDGVAIVAFWKVGSSYYAQNTTLRTRG